MTIDVCEAKIRSRVRGGSGGGGTGGFSWSSFRLIMAIICGTFFGTIIIMAILCYCCYCIISTLEVSEIEKELPDTEYTPETLHNQFQNE